MISYRLVRAMVFISALHMFVHGPALDADPVWLGWALRIISTLNIALVFWLPATEKK